MKQKIADVLKLVNKQMLIILSKLKMDGISTIETEKKISTIKMLEACGKESKSEVIDAITRIIDSSPRTEVVKAGHDSIQRIKG